MTALPLFVFTAAACAQETVTIKTVAHVHSAYSANSSPDMRATLELARRKGIGAVIFADDAIARFTYGLPPLRGLISKTVERNSVLRIGPAAYLEHINTLRARFPGIIIVPGVEAAPFYYWSGNPLTGLVINNWHRHLSVAGMERAEDYSRLPVLGNPATAGFKPWTLWPAGLLALALLLAARGLGRTALCCGLLGFALLADAYPFTKPQFDQYDARADWRPYRAITEYADEKGFLCFWNHPEAPGWSTPQKLSRFVSASTMPYPEALALLPRTDGFAALLEGNRTMTEPGGVWDRALEDFLAGKRKKAPWAFAELDYAGEGKNGVYIDSVYMDVHAATATVAGLLKALKSGRFEAVAPDSGAAASLPRWSVSAGGASALSGETLHAAGNPSVHIELHPAGAPAGQVTVTLLRNGKIIFREQAKLPFSRTITDAPDAAQKRLFYRLDVRIGSNGVLLANPIFVARD